MHSMHKKTVIRVQEICESKLEHHTTCRNDYTTGESDLGRNFQNEACSCVKYSMRVAKICLVSSLRGIRKNF